MTRRLTLIQGTCQVGQDAPCGNAASTVIAVVAVADTAAGDNPRPGGIVFLCDDHRIDRSAKGWNS